MRVGRKRLTTRQRYILQRQALYRRQSGLCYYCRNPMRLGPNGRIDPRENNGNACTIEHLDDKYSPERGKHPGEFRRVAACFDCNVKRSHEREAQMTIEELRARSGRRPRETVT